MAPNRYSPTLAAPRITAIKFRELLLSKNSPATTDSSAVYSSLANNGVDVSFALAQFRVESQYGTAGYAKDTGSWGNMLYDSSLTVRASGHMTFGSYTYATYSNYVDAVEDYSNYIHWYITKYGLTTIYEATARWIGKTPGSPYHLTYVDAIVSDMTAYEYAPGTFYEVGDFMVYAGPALDRATGKLVQKYPVQTGDTLYKGTDGTVLKTYQGTSGLAWWLGPVQGSWSWGALFIGTSAADPDATLVYIKNPSKAKIVNVG